MTASSADARSSAAATATAEHLRDRLKNLARDFEAFDASLPESLLEPIRHGRRPADDCAESLLELLSRFDALRNDLKSHEITIPDNSSIASMLETVDRKLRAGSWSDFVEVTKQLLQGIPRITHPAETIPPPLRQLREAAANLLGDLEGPPGDLEQWRTRVRPFSSLWRLLTEDDLDDQVTEQLEADVAAAFDETLVRRSFITKLRVIALPGDGLAAIPCDGTSERIPAEIETGVAISPKADPIDGAAAATEDDRPDADTLEAAPEAGPKDVHPETVAISPRRHHSARVDEATQSRDAGAGSVKNSVAFITSPQPEVVVEPLPEQLKTFDAFRTHYWLNPATGVCEAVPWQGSGMPDRLRAFSAEILSELADDDDRRLPEFWLASRALEASGRAFVSLNTVRSIAELISEPTRAGAGRDSQRAQRIPRHDEDNSAEVRLALVLEAIRPAVLALVTDDELERLFAVAGFRDGTIKSVVGELFRAHAQGLVEPLEQIRVALKTDVEGRPDPAVELVAKKKALDLELVRLQRNAGSGYVGKFDHCSTAWMEFMRAHARPLAARLDAPPSMNEQPITQSEVELLSEKHESIADHYKAREKARRIMDRAAASLVRHLADVANARQAVLDAKRAKSPPNKRLVEEAQRVLNMAPPADPVERLALRLLRLALSPSTGNDPKSLLTLGTRFLSTYPALLDFFDEPLDWNDLPTAEDLPGERAEIAGTLLYPRPDPLADSDRRQLEALCREERRYERLAKLRSPLPTQDQAGANQEKSRLSIELQQRRDRLRKGWRALEGLLVASQAENRLILDSVDRAIGPNGDYSLACAWLDHVCDFTDRQVGTAIRYWRTVLENDPAGQARLAALDAGQYARATRDLYGAGGAFTPLRETTWRHDARNRFPEPRRVLLSQRAHATIAEKWLADLQDRAKRHKALLSLLSDFTKWVFPPSLLAAGVKDRTTFVVATQNIRDYLSPSQPTYLPQLHNAKDLVIATVPEWPSSSEYRKQVQEVVSTHRDNKIVVVLCPGMSTENRDQIRRELHGTTHFAAIVDDLDLVRLLNPGGTQPNLLLGLLEIVLEQQPRKSRNPFSLPDGKEMRLEMYVGRRDEAEQLATTSAKTRLFSGRKLGKTALLQFIRQTWNGRELPNGRTLRVVYMSIVGVSSEENFAKKFLDQLHADFPAMKLPAALQSPGEIVDVIRRILDAAPTEDVLFVLDEADAFVADQVKLDNTRKGQGLSWKLREIERARFVFTGYWATATRDGAWLNWGDVLELSQLQPEEAAGLIAHPLARMGIDAADQAPEIAFRCGYQPAVLLRFGEALVERLGHDTMKDQVVVTHDLVQDVFADVKVQKEIQGIVRANFQGNPFGHAIFCVVLQESARAPLGHWLSDLESSVASVFDPLVDDGARADLRVAIAAQLRDMHQRKLLRRQMRDGVPEFQLTFPHHLATLLQDLDIDAEIRADLRAWRGTHAGGGDTPLGEGRSPIHRLDLAAVRDLLNPDFADLAPKAVVVASTWPASLVSEPGGVPERLGLPLRIEPASRYVPDSDVRCWQHAGPTDLDRVIASPPARRPTFLFGELDLLRAALAHRAKGDLDLEVVGTHRFTDGQVRWWFQRIQGVEFTSEGDYERVHRATGGVPLLLDLFQDCLMPAGRPDGGMTPTAEVLSEAIAEFQRCIDEGPLAARFRSMLTSREIDLLRMVVAVSAEGVGAGEHRYQSIVEWISEAWTSELFGDAWRRLFAEFGFPEPYGLAEGDLISLETLVLSGAVRSRRDTAPATSRLLAFEDGDPIVALVKRTQ